MERCRNQHNTDQQRVRTLSNVILSAEARLRFDLGAADLADRLAAVRAELVQRSERELLAVTR